jgi:hypothetical protein
LFSCTVFFWIYFTRSAQSEDPLGDGNDWRALRRKMQTMFEFVPQQCFAAVRITVNLQQTSATDCQAADAAARGTRAKHDNFI